MNRRPALAAVLLALAAPYGPMAWAQARRSTPYRIGTLISLTDPAKEAMIEDMRRLGWAHGKDYLFVESGLPYGPHMDEAARRVVSQKPDIIYAVTTAYALAAHRLTTEIPIVMYSSGYPVQAGVAHTLAAPGKNVTGNTSYAGTGIWGKLLQLLVEAKPGIRRVGLLWDYLPPAFPQEEIEFGMLDLRKDAQSLGLEAHLVEVSRAQDAMEAISTLQAKRVEAVLITSGPTLFAHRASLVRRLTELRLPTVTDARWSNPDDALPLLTYAPPIADLRQRAVEYMYRILNGARVGDLPIQQPAKFSLTLNLKIAMAIGLPIAPSLRLRADEVIE